MNDVHVFISSVSAEFGSYRDELRHLLERPNVSVKIQEDFIAAGTATLDKLDDYIASCEAVVHLVGDGTGSPANASSLAWLRQRYPQLAEELPALGEVLDGTVAASYTQWEAYLALYHRKVLLVATPTAEAARDGVPGPAAAPSCQSQAVHLERLRVLGSYPEIHFGTADRLAAEVALSTLLDLLVAAGMQAAGLLAAIQPRKLPYESLGSLFKGRGTFLRRLRKIFAEAGKTRVALYGLGGIGKTRLAVEYAWQNQAHYNALLFVMADSSAALQANLADLCSPLVLNLPEASAQEQDVKLGAVLRWLQQHPGWLLVIDNVDTPAAATAVEKLLAQLRGGHVLLTTRISEWSKHVQCLELEVLPEEDAEEFLLERAARRQLTPTDTADARALARDVGQLALALEQAGAYIEAKRITLQAYRERWATNYKAMREWYDERLMGYAGSVAVTWQTSFDQLTPAARTLLHRLSWLAAGPVPLTLLEVSVPEAEVMDTEDAREDLARYSLVTYSADNSAISIHRLVQEVTRTRFNAEERLQAFKDALGWIDTSFKEDTTNVCLWPKLNPLQPHALAVVTYAQQFDNPSPTAHLLNQLGLLLIEKSRLAEAEPFIRRALSINEHRYGPDHTEVAANLTNLVGLLHTTNRLAEAEPLIRRALAIDERLHSPVHPRVAAELCHLAGLLHATNRLAEAEPLFRRALAIDEHHYGPDHPEVAIDLSNLAQLLADTNRPAEAESLIRRALAIDEHHYGPDHPKVATRLNNLALLLAHTNRLAEAEPLFRRALAIDEHHYGPDHPKVATNLGNLARLLYTTDRLAEAEPFYRRALATMEHHYGPDHPSVADLLGNLAGLLHATNRSAEAEPLFRRALAIDERLYGPDYPNVATDLGNLAYLLNATTRPAEAEPLYRRALAIMEHHYGPDHREVAVLIIKLAHLLNATTRPAEAEPLYRRALAIDERLYGPDHPNVATDLGNLANLLHTTRLAEAEPLYRRALSIFIDFEQRTGSPNPNFQIVGRNYIYLLQQMGHSDDSINRILSPLGFELEGKAT